MRKLRRREFLKASGIVLGSTILSGSPTIVRGVEKAIRIGVILPFSGPNAKAADEMFKGLTMAVEEINGAGGIKSLNGRKIEVVKADSEGKPERGMAEIEKLIQKDVAIVLGALQSSVTLAVSEVTEKNKIPMLVSSSAAENITQRGFKYLFRTAVLSEGWAEARAKSALEAGEKTGQKMKTIALLYENTLWGQSLSKWDREWASKMEVKIVADIPYSASTSDLSNEVTKIKASGAEGLFNVGYIQDSILLTKTMYELDYNPIFDVDGGVGRANPNYLSSVGNLANYGLTLGIWNDDMKVKGAKEAGQDYMKKYGVQMSTYPAEKYVAAYVVKDVLERAGSLDAEKIRKAFSETDLKPGEKGNIYHYRIKFDDSGQVRNSTAIILQYIDKRLHTVWPTDYASKTIVYPKPKWKSFT